MTKRRDFVKSIGRIILLVLVGFGLVWGFRTKKIKPEASGSCTVNPGCQGCGKLEACSQEQAEKVKGTGNTKTGQEN